MVGRKIEGKNYAIYVRTTPVCAVSFNRSATFLSAFFISRLRFKPEITPGESRMHLVYRWHATRLMDTVSQGMHCHEACCKRLVAKLKI